MHTKKVQKQQVSKLFRLWRLVRLVPKALKYKLLNNQAKLYTLLCDEFLELGGIYVKFLQGVLLQSDVMKNWEGTNKYRVFEAVPVVEINLVAVLEHELGRNPTHLFSYLEDRPFATGSFGQVYRASLHSGEDVIIKVLRPNIRKILKFDLRLLGIIAKLFTADFTSLDVSLNRAIRDFKAMTLREVDYIGEAEFANEMYEAFLNDSYIFVPRTFRELCTTQVIVQEYVPGVSVAEILNRYNEYQTDPVAETRRLVGSDLKFQLTHFATEVLYRFFTSPRMPGDLHPGNVKLLPNNMIGIIDFGVSAHMPRVPNIFYSMLQQLTHVQTDGATAGQMFLTYIKYFSYDLYLAFDRLSRQIAEGPKLTDLVTDYAQAIFNKTTNGSFQVGDIKHATMFGAYVNKMVNTNNRFCIVTKVTEVELLRSVQTIVALIDSLDMRELIEEIFMRVYQRVTRELPHYTREPDNPLTLHESISVVDAWLSRLAVKNPELFLQVRSFMHHRPGAGV